MTRAAGRWIIAIALIHLAYGLWNGGKYLFPIAAEGFWNTVDSHPERRFVFWFVVFAFPALVAGLLISRMEKRGDPPPWWLGLSILVFAIVCGVLMPASGFWLFLVPGLMLVRASRRAARASPRTDPIA